MDKKKVIGIVGSMKFRAYMDELERMLIRDGHVPIAPTRCFDAHEGNLCAADKLALDGLHLRKLALCGSIYVVDVGGYIGESTRREIQWAMERGLEIEYMSDGESDDMEQVREALGLEAPEETNTPKEFLDAMVKATAGLPD